MLIFCRIASGKVCVSTHIRGHPIAPERALDTSQSNSGDAKTGVVFKVYSKWIDGSDHQRERARLGTAFVHGLCGTFITD
jgi:hypothetical protein